MEKTFNINTNLENTAFARFEYVIHFLNHHPVIKNRQLSFTINQPVAGSINYHSNAHESRYIIPYAPYLLTEPDCKNFIANKFKHKDFTLYAIDTNPKKPSDFVKNQIFAFDIFSNIFFHISRIEETIIRQGNYMGHKIDFENQLFLIKNKLEKTPVVDHIIEALVEVLTGFHHPMKKEIILSHDIDQIRKFNSPLSIFRKLGGHLFHRKTPKGLGKLVASYREYLLEQNDPFDNFDWLLSKAAIPKRIYFLAGGSHRFDTPYDFSDPIMTGAVKLAKERNYEFGIHPSYDSWKDIELIIQQKAHLEQYINQEVTLSRQHFLNFDMEITPPLLLEAGIKEDSSLGYTRYVGYRCGTAYAYQLYNFTEEAASELVEVPPVFMDVAWLYEWQRNEETNLIFLLGELSGCFNFHNTFFDEMEVRNFDVKSLYEALLEENVTFRK